MLNSLLIPIISILLSAETGGPSAELVSVKKIWDQGPHNAFTDLIRYQGKFICTFREGAEHVLGDGKIRVLSSSDGETWQSLALLARKNTDLRDPKLSILPNGELMMVGGAAFPATRDPLQDHYTFVCQSDDGAEWTPPRKAMESWKWLWRVTWHDRMGYGVAYSWDRQERPRTYKASLWRTPAHLNFFRIADFEIKNPTEATIRFDGDTMFCLQRRDGQPNTAQLGRSEPPYKDWQWQDLGHYFGGPNFLKGPAGNWWAVGRLRNGGSPKTVLCRLDVDEGKLEPVITLPSGGDTSYPGMLFHDGLLWISYYSSHEGKSSIYLATVKISD